MAYREVHRAPYGAAFSLLRAAAANSAIIDGRCRAQGVDWLDMPASGLINMTYAMLVETMTEKERQALDDALSGPMVADEWGDDTDAQASQAYLMSHIMGG